MYQHLHLSLQVKRRNLLKTLIWDQSSGWWLSDPVQLPSSLRGRQDIHHEVDGSSKMKKGKWVVHVGSSHIVCRFIADHHYRFICARRHISICCNINTATQSTTSPTIVCAAPKMVVNTWVWSPRVRIPADRTHCRRRLVSCSG